jgi:hypothetical protein
MSGHFFVGLLLFCDITGGENGRQLSQEDINNQAVGKPSVFLVTLVPVCCREEIETVFFYIFIAK